MTCLVFLRRNLNYWDSVSTLAGEVANPGTASTAHPFSAALLMYTQHQ